MYSMSKKKKKNSDYSQWCCAVQKDLVDGCVLWIIFFGFKPQDSWGLNIDPYSAQNRGLEFHILDAQQAARPLVHLCLSFMWCGFTDSLLERNQPTVVVLRFFGALGCGSLETHKGKWKLCGLNKGFSKSKIFDCHEQVSYLAPPAPLVVKVIHW